MVQELSFIDSINRAIARGTLKDPRYRTIRVGRIPLDRELSYRSKLDRRPEKLRQLRLYGHAKWRSFLKDREVQGYSRGVPSTTLMASAGGVLHR
jgi:hypothetical protein